MKCLYQNLEIFTRFILFIISLELNTLIKFLNNKKKLVYYFKLFDEFIILML